MDDQEFRRHADAAIEALKQALLKAEESAEIEVEESAGALKVNFEGSGAIFVVSPNSAVRQIWISALATSFKLDWLAKKNQFVLGKTGEDLKTLMARLINQQLGEEAVALS
jgi:iron-sulfur cluster assembly protein CyaY